MTLIDVDNLSLGYNNEPVIKNLSFEANEGDFICVVGPNGSGKSTLIKGILGLIKPIKGKIVLNGLKRNFIGYLPQDTDVNENFPATVFEIVLSGALNQMKNKMFYDKELKAEVLSKMKLVGVDKIKNRPFSELSGGQRQKVLLARALVSTSKLLILDEPSNHLDKKSIQDTYKLLNSLNRKGITIVMVTHDLDHDNLIGNKILSLNDEYFFGTTSEFVKRVHHE